MSGFVRYRIGFRLLLTIVLTVQFQDAAAQAPPPAEQMQTMSFESPIEPEFKKMHNVTLRNPVL